MSRPFVKKRGRGGAELTRLLKKCGDWKELPPSQPLDDAAVNAAYKTAQKVFETARKMRKPTLQGGGEKEKAEEKEALGRYFHGIFIGVYDDEFTIRVATKSVRDYQRVIVRGDEPSSSSSSSADRRVRVCPGGTIETLPMLLQLELQPEQRKRFHYTWTKPCAKVDALCEVVAAVRMAGIPLTDPVSITINNLAGDQKYDPSTLEVAKVLRTLGIADACITEYSGDCLETTVAACSVYSNGYTAGLMVYARSCLSDSLEDVKTFKSVLNSHMVTHLSLHMTCRDVARWVTVFNSTPCLRSLSLEFDMGPQPGSPLEHACVPFPVDAEPYLDELTTLRVDIRNYCRDMSCRSVSRVLKFICSRAPNITTFLADFERLPVPYHNVFTRWLPELPMSTDLFAERSRSFLNDRCDFTALLPNLTHIGLLYNSQFMDPFNMRDAFAVIGKRLRKSHPRLVLVTPAGDHRYPSFYDEQRLQRLAAWQSICLGVGLDVASRRTGIPVNVRQTAKDIRAYIGRTYADVAPSVDENEKILRWHLHSD